MSAVGRSGTVDDRAERGHNLTAAITTKTASMRSRKTPGRVNPRSDAASRGLRTKTGEAYASYGRHPVRLRVASAQRDMGLIWRKILAPCLAPNSLARLFVRSGQGANQ